MNHSSVLSLFATLRLVCVPPRALRARDHCVARRGPLPPCAAVDSVANTDLGRPPQRRQRALPPPRAPPPAANRRQHIVGAVLCWRWCISSRVCESGTTRCGATTMTVSICHAASPRARRALISSSESLPLWSSLRGRSNPLRHDHGL